MKIICCTFILMIVCLKIEAQDLIVTKGGDSLNCKVTKVEPDYVYFTIRQDDKNLPTLLPKNELTALKFKYYSTPEVIPEPKVREEFPRLRIGANGGWSTRLAKIHEDVDDAQRNYLKSLKSGYNYSFDLTYYFSLQSGIGAKYAAFRSKYGIEDFHYDLSNGQTFIGELSDDITINFIGPFYSTRAMTKSKKNSFIANMGLGYVGYKDKVFILEENLTLTGSTFGLCFDLGYDIGISQSLALGIQLSVVTGNLTKYEISDGVNSQVVELDEDNYENLSRFDLSVGLRFIK
jgi:hypothetical protein